MKITYQKAQSTKQGVTFIKVDLDGRNVGRIIRTADPGWQYWPKRAKRHGGGPVYPGGIEGLQACQKSLEEIEPRFLGPEANEVLELHRQSEAQTQAGKPTYENTYWNHKGKYPKFNAELEKLIPSMGPVPNADENPALEQYRVATNCYYDLYNNGLYNRAEEFREVFGFDAMGMMEDAGYEKDSTRPELTQEVIDHTERMMDELILAAYSEQIGDPYSDKPIPGKVWAASLRGETETIDLTPAGCHTPEGNARVARTMHDFNEAHSAVALEAVSFFNEWGWMLKEGNGKIDRETRNSFNAAVQEMKNVIHVRAKKQEAFLRAVAGVPEPKS